MYSQLAKEIVSASWYIEAIHTNIGSRVYAMVDGYVWHMCHATHRHGQINIQHVILSAQVSLKCAS